VDGFSLLHAVATAVAAAGVEILLNHLADADGELGSYRRDVGSTQQTIFS
jgi:hypothetical protein